MEKVKRFGYKLQIYYLCLMGKNRINKYEELATMPDNAITVYEYAQERDCNTSYIYKLWREHRDKQKAVNFKIVVIRGINFVLR